VVEQTVVAKVFVQNISGQLLLLQRSETDPRRPLQWDLPGGMVEQNEFVEQAAARETFEEAGLKIDPLQLKLVYTQSITYDDSTGVTTSDGVTLSYEHSAYQWASIEEALQILTYEIHHEALEYAIAAKLLS
jgi:8-oxo-dGTP pyrophosphatase MutT (NUDIX family)